MKKVAGKDKPFIEWRKEMNLDLPFLANRLRIFKSVTSRLIFSKHLRILLSKKKCILASEIFVVEFIVEPGPTWASMRSHLILQRLKSRRTYLKS